jgi:hypothetical protein
MKSSCFFIVAFSALVGFSQQPASVGKPRFQDNGFDIHRIAEPDADFDGAWHTLPAASQPTKVDRYVWIYRRTGRAFYVTVAIARDDKDARLLLDSSAKLVASAMPVQPPEFGADKMIRFGDRRVIASWGRNVADAFFPGHGDEPPAELANVLDELQRQFSKPAADTKRGEQRP